jgi:hypothetical protein
MHVHEAAEGEQGSEPPLPSRALATESTAERLLALQRSAGNAAVGRMLARQASTQQAPPDPFGPADPKSRPPDRLSLTDVKFACFFIPAADPEVGAPMRKLIRIGGGGHVVVDAGSLEEAIEKMHAHMAGRKDVRIAEIVLVAHGRPEGRIDMPLVRGGADATPETIINLQTDFKSGPRAHQQFQIARAALLSHMDDGTQVVVRGCRAGLNPALVWNLTAFFGGQATVYVPTIFYGVDELTIGGPLLADEVAAYDFLESHGFIPYGSAFDDESKTRWVRKNLPNGKVPEAYLLDITDEEKKKLKAGHHADDPEIQQLKDYESAAMIGLKGWAEGRSDVQGRDDEMEDKKSDELVALARAHLTTLRKLEATAPDDWKSIGKEAWWVLRAHNAWSRRGDASRIDPDDRDPIGGLYMPGLSYDVDVLAGQAARRGDLVVAHEDIFLTAELEASPAPIDLSAPAEGAAVQGQAPPAPSATIQPDAPRGHAGPTPTAEELRDRGQALLDAIDAEEAKSQPDVAKIASLAKSMLALHDIWSSGPGVAAALADSSGDPLAGLYIPGLSYDTNLLAMKAASKPAARRAGKVPAPKRRIGPAHFGDDGEIVFDDDRILPDPKPPEMDPVTLGLEGSADPSTLGGGIRPVNYKHKFPIPGVKDVPLGEYFTLKGLEVGLEGYVEWGAKGVREVAIGQLLSYEPGKPLSVGFKGDAKLAGGKADNGWYWKWKGGFEFGENTDASERGKLELSTTIEWGWVSAAKGPAAGYVGEAKLFCSFDTVKGELRIGGVKFSPVGIQGEFPIPLSDGTQVTLKGKALLSGDIQPNWGAIAERLGLEVGTEAAVTVGGGVAAGEAIAAGFAAVTVGEVVVLTGAVTGTAALLYAYYRSVKDWEDIKEVKSVADQASADLRAGFVSAFGIPDKGGGALFDKGAELARTLSRKRAENMVKGWEARNPGQRSPFTVDQAEQFTRERIAASAELTKGLRAYAFGAFDEWVRAEFYRQWVHQHKGEIMQPHNDPYARALLGFYDKEPPKQPDWFYVPKPEGRVIEEEF